jgi:hypothetical protein
MSDSDRGLPDCSGGETYHPNPRDPRTFYECVDGVPQPHQCPLGQIFNPKATPGPVCDYPQNVEKYWDDDVKVAEV